MVQTGRKTFDRFQFSVYMFYNTTATTRNFYCLPNISPPESEETEGLDTLQPGLCRLTSNI